MACLYVKVTNSYSPFHCLSHHFSQNHVMLFPRIEETPYLLLPLYFATMLTTSSSATTCPNPTRCGTCLALAPHTNAYLNVSLSVLCT